MHKLTCRKCQAKTMSIEVRFSCIGCEHSKGKEIVSNPFDLDQPQKYETEYTCEYTDEETENCGCYIINCSECGAFVEQLGDMDS